MDGEEDDEVEELAMPIAVHLEASGGGVMACNSSLMSSVSESEVAFVSRKVTSPYPASWITL